MGRRPFPPSLPPLVPFGRAARILRSTRSKCASNLLASFFVRVNKMGKSKKRDRVGFRGSLLNFSSCLKGSRITNFRGDRGYSRNKRNHRFGKPERRDSLFFLLLFLYKKSTVLYFCVVSGWPLPPSLIDVFLLCQFFRIPFEIKFQNVFDSEGAFIWASHQILVVIIVSIEFLVWKICGCWPWECRFDLGMKIPLSAEYRGTMQFQLGFETLIFTLSAKFSLSIRRE